MDSSRFGKQNGPGGMGSTVPNNVGLNPSSSSSTPPPLRPPPFAYADPRFHATTIMSRGTESIQRVPSTPSYFQGSGPVLDHYQSAVFRRPVSPQLVHSPPFAFESTNYARGPHQYTRAPRATQSPPDWGAMQRSLTNNNAVESRMVSSEKASFVASRNSGTVVTVKVARSPDLGRTRSPPLMSTASEDISKYSSRSSFQNNSYSIPPGKGSPTLGFSYSPLTNNFAPPFVEDQRPKSPPRLGANSKAFYTMANSQIPQKFLSSANDMIADTAATMPTSSQIAKRARSPPINSMEEVVNGNMYSPEDGTEREMQAKAKRLARFKVELSEATHEGSDILGMKDSSTRLEHSSGARPKLVGRNSVDSALDAQNSTSQPDNDGLDTSTIILGTCPDMCPDSERGERERKGDLDLYERLEGDRNQTSKVLAVKKYTRTAEREADLIRPMPVLQKTIDYLLSLLDQPYDERFLAMYNFLWDRMRAIRMDLRMQHIFDRGAITMLEKMIRLHIIAMHELCEYTKGEGFSEGFDAHLNIEQMNKTSVELFQLYDDHRKRGIEVLTEKEFRGYYALLKLDKHPGYRVEPAELSLDLAKMTPEIRQTSEVRFARDVARACRTSNFISFFRLAKKATYLQACLMHAHFSKLRTQALASLHSGLQYNQGLPVSHAAKWLGMEEEDMESLLDYHGFLIKEFEELYLVKEGPFLNGDKDYPIKCSNLVHHKRSKTITRDVYPIIEDVTPSTTHVTFPFPVKIKSQRKAYPSVVVENKSFTDAINEDATISEAILSPKFTTQFKPIKIIDGDHQLVGSPASPKRSPAFSFAPTSQPVEVMENPMPNNTPLRIPTKMTFFPDVDSMSEQNVQDRFSPRDRYLSSPRNTERYLPLQNLPNSLQDRAPNSKLDNLEDTSLEINHENGELGEKIGRVNFEAEHVNGNDEAIMGYHEEVARAKYKLILRLWKRWSSRKRKLREQRQLAANAALASLSMGPPLQYGTDQSSKVCVFDLDNAIGERFVRHEQSWSKLNVSDLVADILHKRNPNVECLCWKLILCSHADNSEQKSHVSHLATRKWLFSKLMPCDSSDNKNMGVSSPGNGISIWKKWIPSQSDRDPTCCLLVIIDSSLGNLNETVIGASAVLFLVSDSAPWRLQKIQLHNIIMSIPSGSPIPLFILSDSYNCEVSDPSSALIHELGLNDIDRSKISSFSAISLVGDHKRENSYGFFGDEALRGGLKWLASESPIQPVLHGVKVRELVLTHLTSSLEVLRKMADLEICPQHCVYAFNEALDHSVREIELAAKSKPTGFPCPEIFFLPENCDERLVVRWHLPELGWNATTRIEAILSAVRNCKLPNFPDENLQQSKGFGSSNEIANCKSVLKDCLVGYLTEMMGSVLASNEAHILLQQCVQLELQSSSYCINPKWDAIFRRIFNWRLASLSICRFSLAYVLDDHDFTTSASENIRRLNLVTSSSRPSLDEIIQASQPEKFFTRSVMIPNGKVQLAPKPREVREEEINVCEMDVLASTNDYVSAVTGFDISSTITVESRVNDSADKLSKLLEHCHVQQNSNREILSLYF